MAASRDAGVHLVRTIDRADEVDALADRLGGRAGLTGVLHDLDRTAAVSRVPGRAVSWGFRWDDQDQRTRRWWPQGISGSADASATGELDGRRVLVTSAYSRKVDGYSKGARLSFVDVTDRTTLRYRHVLLVEPHLDADGGLDLRPVRLHAGGIVWHGGHVHVAGTARGLASFRLDDVVRVPAGGDPARLGPEGGTVHGFGYRYLLPLRFRYDAATAPGHEPLRYSFVSLDRTASPPALVAGEYGTGAMTTRLVRYEVDPGLGLLRIDDDGVARPSVLDARGVGHTQGATVVAGRWYLTTSAGRYRRGSVWTGTPGRLRRSRSAVPPGVEDLHYCGPTDELWSLSEHPGRRYVFAMDRGSFG